MKLTVHNLNELEVAAAEFIKKLTPDEAHALGADRSQATIVGLSGNLGAGKTTFTQIIARLLGVSETVTSPTFIIEKIYGLNTEAAKIALPFSKLIHIDAYRLEKATELERLGFAELASDPTNLILIEWPERVAELLPTDMIKVSFEHVGGDENARELTFTYGQN